MIIRCKECGRSVYRKKFDELCECQQSKKEHSHADTIGHIQKAIKSLGYDVLSSEVRQSLTIALNKLSKKKQHSPTQKMQQKGVNAHNEWWATIEQAVRTADKSQGEAVTPRPTIDP